MSAQAPAILEFSRVTKRFHDVTVLHDVSFALPQGHTLGLVGENGAGKSTLLNILGGNLRPESGELRLEGRPYRPDSPRDAAARGIAFIHQELNLFANLSIAENLFLTALPRPWPRVPWIHRRRLRDQTRRLLDQVGLSLDPDTPVEALPAGERQLVEIAKALGVDARLILLDEPTTSLTERESRRLFELMDLLRARGISMIYISHNLGDVLSVAQDILVLRDGRVVDQGLAGLFTPQSLVAPMVGREITQIFPERSRPPSEKIFLEARRLSHPGVVRDISFQLRRGEVLGVAGLLGSGRSELARILLGLDPAASGSLRLEGRDIGGLSTRERIRLGVAFLTEDRKRDGLCLEASIADNMALAALERHARGIGRWIDGAGVERSVDVMRGEVRLTASARNSQPVKTLSGGNQQKVVLAKWLLNTPRVFVLDEPTRGIDVGAKCEVYRLINQLAESGAGILMISSEIEELIGLCDRVLIMSRGEIVETFDRARFDRERMLRAALRQEELMPEFGSEGGGG